MKNNLFEGPKKTERVVCHNNSCDPLSVKTALYTCPTWMVVDACMTWISMNGSIITRKILTKHKAFSRSKGAQSAPVKKR